MNLRERDEFNWSAQFNPIFGSIVHAHIRHRFTQILPTQHQDRFEKTDFHLIYPEQKFRVSARCRRFHNLKWCDEVTIRSSAMNPKNSEWVRFLDGACDFFVYGFAAKGNSPPNLSYVTIIDLEIFRVNRSLQGPQYGHPMEIRRVGQNNFMTLKLNAMQEAVLVSAEYPFRGKLFR